MIYAILETGIKKNKKSVYFEKFPLRLKEGGYIPAQSHSTLPGEGVSKIHKIASCDFY